MHCWRTHHLSVTPKAHGCKDHAMEQWTLHEHCASYTKDWVERMHQEGLKLSRRAKGVRARDKKFKLCSKWESI